MLKKMLKGCLAIAAICALSAPAYADVYGSIAGSFGSMNSGGTSTYDAGHFFEIGYKWSNDEGSSARLEIEDRDGTLSPSEYWVSAAMTDSVKMEVGSMASVKIPMLGHGTTFNSQQRTPNSVFAGPGIPSLYIATAQALQFAIGLGGAGNVYAGLVEGTDIGFYGLYTGAAGDLDYTIGMAKGGADTNTGFMINYNVSKSMRVAFDYAMDDNDANDAVMLLNFAMRNLGPGNLDLVVASQGSTSYTALKYGAMVSGVSVEGLYTSKGDDSWVGLNMGVRY